jgi:aerobic carbon-monoxide dehydrogenase small subunit
MQAIKISVNGQPRDAMVSPEESLLGLIRDGLGLTGTKEGCSTGYCGACTVLVDGEPVNACLYFAVDADRKDITTVEGLAENDGHLSRIQRSFIDAGGLQCGYCTPGMLVSATALLARDPSPSEADVRRALAGNLCRCTGYQAIVQAVRNAASDPPADDPAALPSAQAPRLRARA